MEKLIEKFYRKIASVDTSFVRSKMKEINWNTKLIGIKGQRGVGKTTFLLQYIKLHFSENLKNVLYVSLDDLWFTENKLVDLADTFVKHGGKILFLDEVHKYPLWSQSIKNLYDDYPELKIVFTGSSMLEILNSRSDLSRRAIVYQLDGLSFREYIHYVSGIEFRVHSLQEIVENHTFLSAETVQKIKPLEYFQEYLKYGYYPYFKEEQSLFLIRLQEVVNFILEIEIPQLKEVSIHFLPKIKQLLFAISESVPFMPNISKLSERVGVSRETLLNYIQYLNDAQLINILYKDTKGITRLQKPDKIFMQNTNLSYSFGNVDRGSLRETFFVNQIRNTHQISYSDIGDFKVNDTWIFEIGGKNKTKKQIREVEQSFVVADDIEFGVGNKIPLWLFGFMY
ncbi:ATP-binding protein [Capnocytophaga canis]|uniref:ATP-binding protein n=1 Tax=Capnocytophaga TaxID=1016 RepID=UPI000BB1CA3C|nr:AAA family ATPase [Capnocytophaga sp. H4358]ATA72665.1 AAA family ATPase [Capnocytophaga sp. H4358]